MTTWYAYLLCCRDGTLYVGITLDVERRFREHCRGAGSTFVRSRGADHLVAWRVVGDATAARRLERRLKTMTRVRKIKFFAPSVYTGYLPRPS
ncbi:GIY-YIG nuclease family protein [Pseudoxanthomonas mexicana]